MLTYWIHNLSPQINVTELEALVMLLRDMSDSLQSLAYTVAHSPEAASTVLTFSDSDFEDDSLQPLHKLVMTLVRQPCSRVQSYSFSPLLASNVDNLLRAQCFVLLGALDRSLSRVDRSSLGAVHTSPLSSLSFTELKAAVSKEISPSRATWKHVHAQGLTSLAWAACLQTCVPEGEDVGAATDILAFLSFSLTARALTFLSSILASSAFAQLPFRYDVGCVVLYTHGLC